MLTECHLSPVVQQAANLRTTAHGELNRDRRVTFLHEGLTLCLADLTSGAPADTLSNLHGFAITYGLVRDIWHEVNTTRRRGILIQSMTDFNNHTTLLAQQDGNTPILARSHFDGASLIEMQLEDMLPQEDREELMQKRLTLLEEAGKKGYTAARQTQDWPLRHSLLQLCLNSRDMAFKVADGLAGLAPESERVGFLKRAHSNIFLSAGVARELDKPREAMYCYSIASNVSERLSAEFTRRRKIKWLKRCYGERVRSARLATKIGKNHHAAVSWGLAAKAISRMEELLSPVQQETWLVNAIVANREAGISWLRLGLKKNAEESFTFADLNRAQLTELKLSVETGSN